MMVAEGILTTRGGLVSHAAVVARGWGKPAVVGAEDVRITGKSFTAGGVTVHEGDVISISGTQQGDRRGRGRAAQAGGGRPSYLDTLLGWADDGPRGRASPCGPTPTRASTRPGPASSGPRASGCAGPSTCSSATTACPSCGP